MEKKYNTTQFENDLKELGVSLTEKQVELTKKQVDCLLFRQIHMKML